MGYIREHKWSFIIAIISLLIIAGAAFLLFNKGPASGPSQSNVLVSLDAPQTLSSGAQIIYKVTITNKETIDIQNVKLSLVYPNGFTFQTSSPDPAQLDGTLFNLNNIPAGQSVPVSIKGTLTGNSGEVKQLNAVARYQFANLSSQFVSQSQIRTQISNSNVSLSFAGPTTTSNAQTITYTVVYGNATSADMQNLVLSLSIPSHFIISSSSPQLDGSNNLKIANLKAGQNQTLTIVGQFNGANSNEQDNLSAQISGQDSSSGDTLDIADASYQVTIQDPPLQLSATINDSGSGSQLASSAKNVVMPGDTLTYNIHFQNNGQTSVNNLSITATIVGTAADLGSIIAQNANIQNNKITWNGSEVSQLVSLAPQASGDLSMRFSLSSPVSKGVDKNMQVHVDLSIISQEYPQGFNLTTPNQQIQTVPKLADSVSFINGANPPKVNNTSTYLVNLTLTNSTNDIKNGVLTFSLPRVSGFDTNTVNSDETKNVSYNAATNTLNWNVGTVNAHAGQFSAARKLQFAITIQPSVSDDGANIKLVHSISFTGTDSFTGVPVNIDLQDLTTDNVGGGGNGTVQKN
jgi:uncharacterized repeat protein (TIGR01451 family)